MADQASGEFTEAVLSVVEAIPAGRVMSYGDVAAELGSRGARAVGQVMAYYGSAVPWWRVLRAGGHPPRCHGETARAHYELENTPLIATHTEDGYRVDYATARWRPNSDS